MPMPTYATFFRCFILIIFLCILNACAVTPPEGIEPVTQFDKSRYLGKWYEVARLDNRFEKGLSRVTAEYSVSEEGGIRVLNRGYDADKNEWKQAEGRAFFVEDETTGFLKVSFFGPFYGAYVIFELDYKGYQYALVAGDDRSYLWLLARTPELEANVKADLMTKAKARDFDVDNLVWVRHSVEGVN